MLLPRRVNLAVSAPQGESSESSVFPVGPIGGRMKDKTVDITPVKPILNAMISSNLYINLSRIFFVLRVSLIAFQITLLRYTSFSPLAPRAKLNGTGRWESMKKARFVSSAKTKAPLEDAKRIQKVSWYPHELPVHSHGGFLL